MLSGSIWFLNGSHLQNKVTSGCITLCGACALCQVLQAMPFLITEKVKNPCFVVAEKWNKLSTAISCIIKSFLFFSFLFFLLEQVHQLQALQLIRLSKWWAM